METKLSVKLVSLFLIGSVCLLGYTAMSTMGTPTPTAGKVAISDQVQIKQGSDVSYYFADDAYLDKLEVTSTYLKLDDRLQMNAVAIIPVNITIGGHSLSASRSSWTLASDASANLTFTISGLEGGAQYYIKVDGNRIHQVRAMGGGELSFAYSGPWSEHTFEVVKYDIYGQINDLSSSFLYLTVVVCLVVVLLLMVEKVKSKAQSRGKT